jgi:hypothetical protein
VVVVVVVVVAAILLAALYHYLMMMMTATELDEERQVEVEAKIECLLFLLKMKMQDL